MYEPQIYSHAHTTDSQPVDTRDEEISILKKELAEARDDAHFYSTRLATALGFEVPTYREFDKAGIRKDYVWVLLGVELRKLVEIIAFYQSKGLDPRNDQSPLYQLINLQKDLQATKVRLKHQEAYANNLLEDNTKLLWQVDYLKRVHRENAASSLEAAGDTEPQECGEYGN